MHKGLSFIMMILLVFVGFQQAIIIVHFKLNQKHIEDKYCINKSRPNLHCYGTCFLTKQLKKSEESASKTMEYYPRVDVLPTTEIQWIVWNRPAEEVKTVDYYSDRYLEEPFCEIFKPPPLI